MPGKAFRDAGAELCEPLFPAWGVAGTPYPAKSRSTRKAFRGVDSDLEAPLISANSLKQWFALGDPVALWGDAGRPPRKAFRGVDADLCDDGGVIVSILCGVAALICGAADIGILGGMASILRPLGAAHLPSNLVAEGSYLMVTTVIAYVVDAQALFGMFLASPAAPLNWSAATGVICSVLKLSMVNRSDHYALLAASSRGYFESFYGGCCCVYLATYFAMAVLHNSDFQLDQVAKKMLLYAASGLALGTFSGLFAVQSSLGWLVVLHAVVVAWAVSRCKRHTKRTKSTPF